MYVSTSFASTSHVDELARIGYEAFRDVSVKHGVKPDFPNVDLARDVYKMLVRRKDYYGVVAMVNGKVVGSNFISTTDAISGIGPLSVEPQYQGMGIGRRLMVDVLDYAARHNLEQVRLLQDAYNVSSLSLYASLGFAVRDAIALITTVPQGKTDPTIRTLRRSDLEELDALSTRLCREHRHNELVIALDYGLPAFLRERDGKISAYLVPGLAGHGVAESEDDALALMRSSARFVPSSLAKVFCPVRYSGLLRSLLKAGGKIEKTMTYMSYGPYHHPDGVCTPSASY